MIINKNFIYILLFQKRLNFRIVELKRKSITDLIWLLIDVPPAGQPFTD